MGWRRLMFNHIDHDSTAVSVIGFDLEHNVLASQGSSNWMPELLPQTYNHNQDIVHGCSYMAPRTGLAGDLSVLLGMAALSVRPSITPNGNMFAPILRTLERSFTPPVWREHKDRTGSKTVISLHPLNLFSSASN